MSEFRMLTTPEEVLAALRAGERVESCLRDSGWDPTDLDARSRSETVAQCIAYGIRYRVVPAEARPRTFTAAEVAEVVAGIVGEWRNAGPPVGMSDYEWDEFHRTGGGKYAEAMGRCADELHERITHWLRENEG